MGQRSSTPTVFPFPQGQPAAGSDCRASELLGNYDFQDCPPAGNGLLSPAKKKLAKSAKTPRDPDAEGDPLTLTGNIGHFGVGAQHSVRRVDFCKVNLGVSGRICAARVIRDECSGLCREVCCVLLAQHLHPS